MLSFWTVSCDAPSHGAWHPNLRHRLAPRSKRGPNDSTATECVQRRKTPSPVINDLAGGLRLCLCLCLRLLSCGPGPGRWAGWQADRMVCKAKRSRTYSQAWTWTSVSQARSFWRGESAVSEVGSMRLDEAARRGRLRMVMRSPFTQSHGV